MKIRWLISWGCVFLFVLAAICLPTNTTLLANSAVPFQKDHKTDNMRGTVKDPQGSVISGAMVTAKCVCGCAGTARPACAHSCGGTPCTGASLTYSHIIIGDVVENQPATFSVLAPNGTALAGFVVDFDNGQHVMTDDHGIATFTPTGRADFNAKISDICETKVHIITSDEASKLPPSVPHFAMAGNQLSVTQPGLFDGIAGNTQASIGDKRCDVLSESPGQAILKVPTETPLGASRLHIECNGRKLDQPISVIRFSMRADKTTLRRGESTKGAAIVDGASPVLVGGVIHLTNLSPETIQLQAAGGSEKITKRIESNMIKNGRIEIPLTIRASQGGGFLIVGSVQDPTARTAKCSCGCGGTPRPACAHSCGGTACAGT